MKIAIAAGHGGGDSGATGQNTNEASEAIQIVNRLADKLRADGQVEVAVVPHELNLVDEINWVNKYASDAALCVEVHKNATNNAHGIEVWYYGGDGGSQILAQKALDGIESVPGMPVSRGVKPDTSNRWGSLGWIRDTTPPALLAEMGFISDGGDPVDDAADDRYAEGLKVGILAAVGLKPKPAPVVVNTPPMPTPAPAPVPTPAPAPKDDSHDLLVENNTLLKQILTIVQAILAKITGVFK
jgi:N-acetylmuramoyl-L-alanine amidase